MKLIGMLDSPFVRRVAISLQLHQLPFEHQALSVFRTFDQFQHLNPVVKAPTLICADGDVLMDSTLILAYAQRLSSSARSLMPPDLPSYRRALGIIGLGLAACEKSAQIIYERTLRPSEKHHQPWLDRVTGQLIAAYETLERQLVQRPLAVTSATLDQAGITTAVAWHFTQQTLPEVVPAAHFPNLTQHASEAEQLPEFQAAPYGSGTYCPSS